MPDNYDSALAMNKSIYFFMRIKKNMNLKALEKRSHQILINKVIEIVQEKFVNGFENTNAFKNNLKSNPALQQCLQSPDRFDKDHFPHIKDSHFENYNANLIEGTHFIAAHGPKNAKEVVNFFLATAFNKQLPISNYIALGNKFNDIENASDVDFYDYGSARDKYRRFNVSNSAKTIDYHLEVNARRLSGKLLIKKNSTIRIPKTIVQSKLNLKITDKLYPKETSEKEVTITIYPLKDMGSINLFKEGDDYDKNTQTLEERKEILWQLFATSLINFTVIHCSAGQGRTGHLILMFEILKNRAEIFKSQDPTQICDNILKIIERLRKNRSGLILKKSQLTKAILNADALYYYALEKNYIKEGLSIPNEILTLHAIEEPGFQRLSLR